MNWHPSAFRNDVLILSWADLWRLIFLGEVRRRGIPVDVYLESAPERRPE